MPKKNRYIQRGNYQDKFEIRKQSAAAEDQALFSTQHLELQANSQPLNLWITALLLLAVMTPMVAAKRQYPSDGSFSEQKKFVDSLTERCTKTAESVYSKATNKGLLLVTAEDIPNHVSYKAWKHTLFAADGIATKRSIKIDGKVTTKHSDTTEIFIGSEHSDGKGFLHRFKLKENGDLEPLGKKEQSLEEYTENISASEAVVVQITTEEDNRECYGYKII